ISFTSCHECCSKEKGVLTVLEVIRLPDVHAHEGHELELRESLPRGRGEGQQVPEVSNLRVDEVPPQLRRSLRRLVGIETEKRQSMELNLFEHSL
ncbi:hypothetical protein NPIL_670581, partial [Nephila pilipes]